MTMSKALSMPSYFRQSVQLEKLSREKKKKKEKTYLHKQWGFGFGFSNYCKSTCKRWKEAFLYQEDKIFLML